THYHVFKEARVQKTNKQLAKFKTRNAGQVCVSPTRFYVHEKVYASFLDTFVDTLKGITVGDGLEADTETGPLAHARRVPVMSRSVEDSVSRGGKVLLGGEPLGGKGNFFPPTVITEIPEDAMIMTEEPFGPLAPVVPFTDPELVIRQANALPFGLSSYVYTTSLQTA